MTVARPVAKHGPTTLLASRLCEYVLHGRMDETRATKPSRLLGLQQQFQRKLSEEKTVALEIMRREVSAETAVTRGGHVADICM